MTVLKRLALSACIGIAASSVQADNPMEAALSSGDPVKILLGSFDIWLEMSDLEFAELVAQPLAYGPHQSEQGMSLVAWMYFARVVQSAPRTSGHNMEWMTWHTNNETFSPPSSDAAQARSHLAVNKALQSSGTSVQMASAAGADDQCPRNYPPQAVTRNDLGFDYLNQDLALYSIDALADYLDPADGRRVDMPVGSIGLKGVFIDAACVGQLNGTPGTGGPLNYQAQAVWDNVKVSSARTETIPMTGLHVMAKLQPTPADPYTSETPSWFWATFELNTNPGLDNVLSMISGRDALPANVITDFTELLAKIGDPNLANYRLSGTQSSFSLADGGSAILGNSKLENFAGGSISQFPQFQTPNTWTSFDASCHSCHATAAFDPVSKQFFAESSDLNEAFPLVVGKLPVSIMDTLIGDGTGDGGYDYQQLDFLWPITFQFLGQE